MAMSRHTAPPQASNPADEVLTPDQVAEILHVTPRLVRELWQRRQLGGVKVGRLVRHRRSDVERYLAERKVEPVLP